MRLYNDTSITYRAVPENNYFVLPTSAIQISNRIEVSNSSGELIYAARVAVLNISIPSTGSARDKTLWLMTTKNLGLAPAALNYALESKDATLSKSLLSIVQNEFVGLQ